MLPQAMELLLGMRAVNPEATDAPTPLRIFRIEVNSDTMVQIDEQMEKQQRMEFLQANGEFMDKATKLMMQAGPSAAVLGPVIMSLWKFGITGFKVGRLIEGTLDAAADKIKAMASQPPPQKPDPEMAKVQAEAQLNATKLQQDAQAAQANAQLEHQREMARMQLEQQNAVKMHEIDVAAEAQKMQLEHAENARQEGFERWKTMEDNATKITVAQIAAGAAMAKQEMASESALKVAKEKPAPAARPQ